MKKLLLVISLVMLLQSNKVSAQITLQFTFDTSLVATPFYCTDIGNNDYKFIFTNFAANSFSIYNMDMSPYITNIQIPSTDSMKNGYSVMYVSKTLFDCDSTNVEYVYENPLGGLKFNVFRTDGTVLLQVDTAYGPYGYGGWYGGSYDLRPIVNTNAGAKLFLIHPIGPQTFNMLVYSLCGNLPEDAYDFSKNDSYVNIFPNPTAMMLNFEIDPPNNQEEFQLLILDANAKELKRENISFSNKYSLDVSNYSNGNYMYSLISKNKVYQSGKFIITK